MFSLLIVHLKREFECLKMVLTLCVRDVFRGGTLASLPEL